MDRDLSLLSVSVLSLALVLQACGGGGGASAGTVPAPSPTPTPTPAPTPTPSPNPTAADLAGQKLSAGQCSGTTKPPLVRLPMDAADYAFILPYGLMVGGHVTPIDHQYFSPTVFDSAPGTYPVYAMADSVLHQITTRTHAGQGSYRNTTVTDYRLVFSLSCRLFYYFDLINELAPGLQAQLAASNGRLPVSAGQLIGRIGNQTLDFAVWDTEKPLTHFLVPEHYDREQWKLYTADPLDYYDTATRAQALQKYVRADAPLSGRIDFDIDARLIGNWFLRNADGSTTGYQGSGGATYWDTHLAFAPHFLDPSAWIISIGNWPEAQGASQFVAAADDVDPAQVEAASGLLKYSLHDFEQRLGSTSGPRWDGTSFPAQRIRVARLTSQPRGCLLVQMLGPREVRIESFPGQSCGTIAGFGAGALRYIR